MKQSIAKFAAAGIQGLDKALGGSCGGKGKKTKKSSKSHKSGKSKKVSERREGEVEAKAKVRRNKLGQTKFKINLDS